MRNQITSLKHFFLLNLIMTCATSYGGVDVSYKLPMPAIPGVEYQLTGDHNELGPNNQIRALINSEELGKFLSKHDVEIDKTFLRTVNYYPYEVFTLRGSFSARIEYDYRKVTGKKCRKLICKPKLSDFFRNGKVTITNDQLSINKETMELKREERVSEYERFYEQVAKDVSCLKQNKCDPKQFAGIKVKIKKENRQKWYINLQYKNIYGTYKNSLPMVSKKEFDKRVILQSISMIGPGKNNSDILFLDFNNPSNNKKLLLYKNDPKVKNRDQSLAYTEAFKKGKLGKSIFVKYKECFNKDCINFYGYSPVIEKEIKLSSNPHIIKLNNFRQGVSINRKNILSIKRSGLNVDNMHTDEVVNYYKYACRNSESNPEDRSTFMSVICNDKYSEKQREKKFKRHNIIRIVFKDNNGDKRVLKFQHAAPAETCLSEEDKNGNQEMGCYTMSSKEKNQAKLTRYIDWFEDTTTNYIYKTLKNTNKNVYFYANGHFPLLENEDENVFNSNYVRFE